mmetsp:Transcript_4520/g.11589  ORF Transcript_4520/g.11589 Transcript_4520/m.11589 type:complete len:88 (-) Transcript_4520:292-555(-)
MPVRLPNSTPSQTPNTYQFDQQLVAETKHLVRSVAIVSLLRKSAFVLFKLPHVSLQAGDLAFNVAKRAARDVPVPSLIQGKLSAVQV